jgi:hypothetical protein
MSFLQENVVLTPFPWYKMTVPETTGGIYELRWYTAQAGKVVESKQYGIIGII